MEFGVQRFAINLPKLLLPEPQVPITITTPESFPGSPATLFIFVDSSPDRITSQNKILKQKHKIFTKCYDTIYDKFKRIDYQFTIHTFYS